MTAASMFRRSVAASFVCAVAAGHAGTFPLEWNASCDASIPHEVEMQPAKLVRCGLMKPREGFKVFADGKPIPVAVFDGKAPGSVRLRFVVPFGTRKLSCTTCADGTRKGSYSESANLFAGAVSASDGWRLDGGKIEHAGERLVLRGGPKTAFATFEVAVPAALAGKAVVQEIVATSRSRLVWGGVIKIVQIDENGKVLPETLCDPRWTSHLRPSNKTVRYVDHGHVHPRAQRLRAMFELRPVDAKYDDYGRPIEEAAMLRPVLEVSKLEVRAATELPFPKWDDSFFAPGVSGRDGDFALRCGGPDAIGFFHQATTRAGWSQAYQFRNERDRALPSGDGTVEAWFRPFNTQEGPVSLFQLYQGIRTRMLKKRGLGEVLGLYHDAAGKSFAFKITDWRGHAYEGKADDVELPAGKWTHVAVAWRCGGKAEVFVGGRRVLSVAIPDFEAVPIADKSLNEVNDLWAQQLFVGCTSKEVRDRDGFGDGRGTLFFDGAVDVLRSSSTVRYSNDFVPATHLSLDGDSRSLFGFDRSFDGKCGGGFGFVPASVFSKRDRVDHLLCGRSYYSDELDPENDPRKVFNILNYPVVPRTDEYRFARLGESASFTVRAGDVMNINAPENLYMDYVEIENISRTEPLMCPIAVRKGALDPRSFGDLRDSLGIDEMSDRRKVNRLFQYVISASDYFMNHQADFASGSNEPGSATGKAMLMLNSYCGFECGPLNNLALELFATAAGCPSAPTAGYGHAFEQVFFDGKNHIYDLSAQKFFPSFDNETSVYLEEGANLPGVFNRMESSCGCYVRMGSRGFWVKNPTYGEKVAMILNPGERFRVWTGNDGQFNNLVKWHATGTYCPIKELNPKVEEFNYAEAAGVDRDFKWLIRRDRVFPQYSTGVVTFDGVPSKENPAFACLSDDSFCYHVRSCYPIVFGEYEAMLRNGTNAAMELSVDGGKTFSPVPVRNGKTVLQYRVKARHDYRVRVMASISSVVRFRARTECEVNTRTYPGWLRGGGDEVAFKAESDGAARVTFGWRRNAKQIVVKGGAYSGALPGFERQLVVVKPGETVAFDVEGVSGRAKIRALGPLRATLKGGRLEISGGTGTKSLIARGYDLPAQGADKTAFAAVEIDDEGARKTITVLVSPGARLLTADSATPAGAAVRVVADAESVQDRIMFRKAGDSVRFHCGALPAGRYMVLPLVRYGGHEKKASAVRMRMPDGSGKSVKVADYINGFLDYYKADYAHPGERARWKWDSSMRTDIQADFNGWIYRMFNLPATDSLEFFVDGKPGSGVEIAAVLIVPNPDLDLRLDMRKILSGLNCAPERIL